MAEMQQASAVLAEAESSLRQQVSGLQVLPVQTPCIPVIFYRAMFRRHVSAVGCCPFSAWNRLHQCYHPFWKYSRTLSGMLKVCEDAG